VTSPLALTLEVVRTNARWIAKRGSRSGDLVIAACVIAALVVMQGAAPFVPPLRTVLIPLGLLFVLFVPGYCLMAATFPRATDLQPAERTALSIASSIGAVAILAPLLDRLGVGLRPAPILLAEVGVSVLSLVVAVVRRDRLARRPPPIRLRWRPRRWWHSSLPEERRSVMLLLANFGLLTAFAALVFLAPRLESGKAELYVLDRDGRLGYYPYRPHAGETITVTLGVANPGDAAEVYRYEIWNAGRDGGDRPALLTASTPLAVAPRAKVELPVSWQITGAGDDQLVRVLLFEDTDSVPIRELRLWLDVQRPSGQDLE
jgi:uncharacterized membrane protein